MGNQFANCFFCIQEPTKMKLTSYSRIGIREKINDESGSFRKCSDEFLMEQNVFILR